jgi:hypothetical protein
VCVCVCVTPPIVARQRLVKNPPIVAKQRLGKNPPIVARQRLCRNVTAVTNTHAIIEELLDALFSMWPVSYQGKQAISSSQNFLLLFLFYSLVGSNFELDFIATSWPPVFVCHCVFMRVCCVSVCVRIFVFLCLGHREFVFAWLYEFVCLCWVFVCACVGTL